MSDVLFLTEAGQGIGFGHLTRMSALKAFMTAQGISAQMIVHCLGPMENLPPGLNVLDWINGPADTFSDKKWRALIVDSYLAPARRYAELTSLGTPVLALDDYQRLQYPVDFVVNPGLGFKVEAYSSQRAVCRGGSDYIIFREAFWNNTWNGLPTQRGSILATTGGSDPHDLLRKIAILYEEYSALTIIAPDQAVHARIREAYPGMRILGLLNENQMRDELGRAEIVISGCGQSLNELALLGKNTVGLLTGKDQEPNAAYFTQSGFLLDVIRWDDPDFIQNLRMAIKRQQQLVHTGRPVPALQISPRTALENYLRLLNL